MNHVHDEACYVLAAIFSDRDGAHRAASELKAHGFHDVWIGVAKRGDDTGRTTDAVEADNFLQRLFGEGDETLHDALVRHGVTEADAASAGVLGVYGAVLTVEGGNHPEEAAQVLSATGGRLITAGYGATGYGTTGSHDLYDEKVDGTAGFGATAVGTAASRGDYGRFRAGETIDDAKRLQLREERIRIARERRSAGEAQVGKRVVEMNEELDVPVTHEEIFIERRPASGLAGTAGTIGAAGETVRIPLSEERLRVEKDTVVTEEIVVGKRSVTDTQHVTATTRKEVLDVDEPKTTGRGV